VTSPSFLPRTLFRHQKDSDNHNNEAMCEGRVGVRINHERGGVNIMRESNHSLGPKSVNSGDPTTIQHPRRCDESQTPSSYEPSLPSVWAGPFHDTKIPLLPVGSEPDPGSRRSS